MRRADWLPYLKTLRRLPDDVVLDMATRAFDMEDADTCVCGWAMHSALGKLRDADPRLLAADFEGDRPAPGLAIMFGGDKEEWENLFWGVMPAIADADPWGIERAYARGKMPEIERAFVERVAEAVR